MKEINLIDWLPRYLQEYREIKEIMSTENPEIEYLYKEIDITMDNQFIHTCNEKGIERFEKLLKSYQIVMIIYQEEYQGF